MHAAHMRFGQRINMWATEEGGMRLESISRIHELNCHYTDATIITHSLYIAPSHRIKHVAI
jgi:hypothetical protein